MNKDQLDNKVPLVQKVHQDHVVLKDQPALKVYKVNMDQLDPLVPKVKKEIKEKEAIKEIWVPLVPKGLVVLKVPKDL